MNHLRRHPEFDPVSFEEQTDDGLATALNHHLKGLLPEAEKDYRRILQAKPDHPDALHLLGIIAHQMGYHREAVDLISRAIENNPENPKYHNNLGLAFDALNRTVKAGQCFLQALQLDPNYADACNNLGNTLKKDGRIDAAVEYYRKALDLTPGMPEALLNLGKSLCDQGDPEAAIDYYRQAIACKPDYEKAYNNLGNALKDLGQIDAAIDNYRKAICIKPGYLGALNNLGNALRFTNRLAEARQVFQQAIKIAPQSAESYSNFGNVFKDECRLDAALDNYRQAIRLKPYFAEAHFNCAMVQLLSGNFARGWQEYEWRLQRKEWKTICAYRSSLPRWQGEPFVGKRLLVYDEQGYGDTLQFVRYLPLVKALGGDVTFETRPELIALFENLAGIDELAERESYAKPSRQADLYAPLLSLPGIFETTFTNIPATVPYLFADPDKAALWKTRLAMQELKVGLVWAGSSKHLNDMHRSCSLKQFLPLIRIPDVRLYGLQKGAAADQLTDFSKQIPIINYGEELETFDDTAAMVAGLDLVISVDTAVAHLAGAMGKPVWVLLPYACDWRWFLDREDSPWYPTMRLFRQKTPGNWEQVLKRVARELQTLVNNQTSRTMEPPAPNQVEEYYNIGFELQAQGKLKQAMSCYQKALAVKPDFAEALNNLGLILQEFQKSDQALHCFQKAVDLKPDYAQAHYNMGRIFFELDKFNEAIRCFQTALKIFPNYVEAHHNIGLAYHKLRKFSEAASSYRKTLQFKPDHVAAHHNMGNIFLDQGNIDEMIRWYKKALRFTPNDVEPLNTLGKILRDHGKIKAAESYFQQALELKPDFAEARFNRSIALLLQGNFLDGFKDYECRFKISNAYNVYPYRFDKPCWDGASFAGKRLFVHGEQGMGDALQFARYLPMVKARGGTLIFETTKPLIDIFQNFPGVDELVEISPHAKTDAEFDFYVPLLSLPRIFKTTLTTVPAVIPYIFADPGKIGAWRSRLGEHGYKVGIVWAGGAMHIKNKRRSCSLKQFLPLTTIPEVRLYGLQKDTAAAQLKDFSEQIPIINCGEKFETFGDTAAMIASLDLIISVDTAVAHLAGAMGKPVWVLLPFRPDWRWMLDRQDTPWYPTMRLFRQTKNEDWDGVFQRVADELGKSAAEHSEVCSRNPGETFKDRGRLEGSSSGNQQIPERKPDSAEAYFDLGNAFHNRKNYTQAIACYQKALQHKPDFVEVHYNLGNTYLNQSMYDEAAACYQQALVVSPGYVDAWFNLGITLYDSGKPDEAVCAYQKALKFKPDMLAAHFNLGIVLQEQNKLTQAVSCYQNALKLKSDFLEAYNNMGTSFQELGDDDQAVSCFQKALKIKPDYADAHYNLGKTYHDQFRYDAAIDCYQKALEIKPHHHKACNNLAKTYQDTGLMEKAASWYRKALQLKPDYAEARFNFSTLHLLTGDFKEGWRGYEWRFKRREWKRTYPHRYDKPRWDGKNFAGQRLFIHSEQGLGDILQFVRYLTLAKARGGTIIFETLKPLIGLFQGVAGIDELVEFSADGKPATEFDLYAPLLSMPGIFETTLTNIPATVPYLFADPHKAVLWKPRLANQGLKVGLVWAGTDTDPRRACPLVFLKPLANIAGIHLYGLQKGIAAQQIEVEGLPEGMTMINFGPEFEDFSDTAAVVENLDLVISIDTSVAHLAGAMGKPIWVMLPHAADWRWFLERNDSPWYPSMRLFRQQRPGDWKSATRRITTELQKLAIKRN